VICCDAGASPNSATPNIEKTNNMIMSRPPTLDIAAIDLRIVKNILPTSSVSSSPFFFDFFTNMARRRVRRIRAMTRPTRRIRKNDTFMYEMLTSRTDTRQIKKSNQFHPSLKYKERSANILMIASKQKTMVKQMLLYESTISNTSEFWSCLKHIKTMFRKMKNTIT
jgi:hypothetical protein